MKISSIKMKPDTTSANVNLRYMSGIVTVVVQPGKSYIKDIPAQYSRKKFNRVLGDLLKGKKFKSRLLKAANAAHNYKFAETLHTIEERTRVVYNYFD
jgi:hypothetical protein